MESEHVRNVVSALIARPEWHERAACRGRLDDFYSMGGYASANRLRLKALCAGCEVFAECRAQSDSHRLHPAGFMAGESARERMRRWEAEAN